MLEVLKQIGNGTPHQFKNNGIRVSGLPSRNKGENKIVKKYEVVNEWYDVSGLKYRFAGGKLLIEARLFYPSTIIDYLNSIPKDFDITVVLKFMIAPNCVAGLNMLFNYLSINRTHKNILIDLSNVKFGMGTSLEFDKLPSNVKITYLFDSKTLEENEHEVLPNSFEDWMMNCSDSDFNKLRLKLTPKSRLRTHSLRTIAYNFYESLPLEIKQSSDIKLKCDYVYRWCCNNIMYDFTATLPDGSFNHNRRDAQDAIETFKKRKGVCAGRARLLKLFLNNYYMRIPCFLVEGMSGRLPHEWNEVILEDGTSLMYDISKQQNIQRSSHDEYELSKFFLTHENNHTK